MQNTNSEHGSPHVTSLHFYLCLFCSFYLFIYFTFIISVKLCALKFKSYQYPKVIKAVLFYMDVLSSGLTMNIPQFINWKLLLH